MDKNIAAFLDTRAYTVSVIFNGSANLSAPAQKSYIYITNLPDVSIGNQVIVHVEASGYKVCTVIKVDATVAIEPNSSIEYKWLVSKLDVSYHTQLMERNKTITDTVREAYTESLRRQMADSIMAGLPLAARSDLQLLLAPKA